MGELVPLDHVLLPASLAAAFNIAQPTNGLHPTAAKLEDQLNSSVGYTRGQSTADPEAAVLARAVDGALGGLGARRAEAGAEAATAPQPTAAVAEAFRGLHHQQQHVQPTAPLPQQMRTTDQPAAPAQAPPRPSADRPPVAMTKKHRVAWTSELHKRFLDAVEELGVHTAVPKAIMAVSPAAGQCRQHAASWLQYLAVRWVVLIIVHRRAQAGQRFVVLTNL